MMRSMSEVYDEEQKAVEAAMDRAKREGSSTFDAALAELRRLDDRRASKALGENG